MIDFSRTQLTHFAIHYVGNKGLGEPISLSNKEIQFKDDYIKDLIYKLFFHSFKTDIYYKFRSDLDLNLHTVGHLVDDYFSKTGQSFLSLSKKLANMLYDQTMHPKLMGGHFCLAFLKDVIVDGELVDAIGIFKTEKNETYLKFEQSAEDFDIESDTGINITKLDKGCLIYQTERDSGYKLSIVDTNNRNKECAIYWTYDFLNAEIKPNAYYHTSNFIESVKAFCEEKLPELVDDETERSIIVNKTVNYANDHDKIVVVDFEREILTDEEIADAFQDYRKEYNERMNIDAEDEFDVSQTAVKENKKYMRTVLKLDNNFHIYIHGNSEKIEYGFDEVRGEKYMKLFFVNKD